MKKKKILICGASGFIGRNIVEHFAEKGDFEVYGTYLTSKPITDAKVKMLQVDLTNKDSIDQVIKGTDVLIQAAATTSGAKDIVTRPYHHVSDNAVMNSLILRSAYENKVSHVVFFSCSVMYQSSDLPVKESDFDATQEIHYNYFGAGWTKVYIEKMCEFYSRLEPTKYTVIRHSNIYGPYDKFDLEKSHVFGATIAKVINAEDGGKIVIWGSGEEERDLLYVSDLVNFVELAIEKQSTKFELFNVGYGMSISVKELAERIISSSGKCVELEYDLNKPSINTKLCIDATKARRIIGWSPKISLFEGIKRTLEWYKTNIQ